MLAPGRRSAAGALEFSAAACTGLRIDHHDHTPTPRLSLLAMGRGAGGRGHSACSVLPPDVWVHIASFLQLREK